LPPISQVYTTESPTSFLVSFLLLARPTPSLRWNVIQFAFFFGVIVPLHGTQIGIGSNPVEGFFLIPVITGSGSNTTLGQPAEPDVESLAIGQSEQEILFRVNVMLKQRFSPLNGVTSEQDA
jgi:hypothetical protein